ncbi:TPR and ankyrin repeat-containing protein 1-like [Octopus sinensis]|uniref:TPR and ankyrin repeat-containing protein 1-like n=1 Tax=Octopus sinensis TaxID=2607531 RepID=A0A6P7U2Z2_9MOLL|nr:TPR and ankyrin repeat-containing protein 1-like [Octopus sinensis]
MATAAVSNKRKATSAVSKKGMATAAVSKKGMATAAVSNKRKATSAVSKKGIATAAVGKEGIATSAVSNKGIATAAVSKKGIATAAVSKKGIATAAVGKEGIAASAVSNKGIATAAVSKKGIATAAVSNKGKATASVSNKGKATASVSNKGKATASVSNKGKATAAVSNKGMATAAVSNKGIATAADGNGESMTADGEIQEPTAISSTGVTTTTTAVNSKATTQKKRRRRHAAVKKVTGKWSGGKGKKVDKKIATEARSVAAGDGAVAAGGRVTCYSDIVNALLKLYESDKEKYSCLDSCFIEKNGKYQPCEEFLNNSVTSTLIEQLKALNLLPDILPTTEKVKKQKCQKKNSKISNSKPEAFEEITKSHSVNCQPEISEIETQSKKAKNQESNSLKSVPESLESEMKAKIESLTEYKFEEMNSSNTIIKERRETVSERITEQDIKVDICMDFNADVIKDCEQTDSEKDDDDDEDDADDDDDNNKNEDLFKENLFENLNWKVICTQDVWNTLKSRDLTDKTRRQTVLAIKKLASGYKSRCVRKLKDIPNSLKLYTFHLSHNSRIIWQLTINYLPELEQYSEVLCIWKVVFNLNKFRSIIDNIVRCYKASLPCCQYLKPVLSTQSLSGVLSPRVFDKCDDNKGNDICHSYLSINSESEVNIMKFYRFTSSLVRYIFQESTLNASFPFEVKEAESNIIVDNSKEAIIVLGRSGTGKTTCCLYRLWDHYITYWKQANISGSPLFQKLVTNSLDHIRDNKVLGGHLQEQSDEEQDEDDVNDSDDDESKDDSENYCHLHQLFISRNNCLCTEMQKNFKNLCTGENMSENHMEFSGLRFQDLQDNNFPIFLTSKKFWVLLDASLGSPYFFPRNEDMTLRTDFKNWLDEDSSNLFDMDIKENDVGGNFQDFYEVTYDIFEKEFWNRIKYPVPGCHPTLIWTEIMSIIKGSYKSLLSEKGFLSKNEYLEIGKKQAPNFTSDREKVYQAFVKYNKLLRERHLFDEMDVVFNLFSRLRNSQPTFCPIHEIYVDEVQDFTQAELFLMILLVENPNNMFLTGDTAQSIMRGVAFRFCDLKSLFYYLKGICSNLKQLHSINVPQTMHYLTCNYRSHSGVVSLASSVLDLLNRYFPESFDKTEKDFGSYEGPKPKIFEFCNNENLIMLLGGEKQRSNQIEFGAQQAILVANNQAKQELPSFLSSAIVLTIAESKGLEFNDILLYNFFKDSLVTDEWRIITSYLQEIIAETNEDSQGNGQRSAEFNFDVLDSENHPHPLTFDPNKHKVLNSELKYLYTALTRAKHNIWIFDISNEKRTPIFEYFQVLRLVASVDTSSEDPDNTEFARSSTPEEWFTKGMSFFERKHFEIAIKCFQKSGHKKEETVATAFQYVQQAQMQDSAAKKQKHFLIASKYFFDCNMCIRSAWCLSEGGKYELSARLYRKCHKYNEAAVNFKNAKMYEEAVQCYLKISFYGKAVDVLHDAKQYGHAIELIQEYKSLEQSYGDSAPEDFIKNRPTKDIFYLAQQAANLYYQYKDFEKMKVALLHFTTLEDKLNFLEKKRLFKDAAELLRNNGQIQSSMDLLWQNNLFSESVAVAATLNDNKLYADCLYKQAGHSYVVAKLKTMRTPMPSPAAEGGDSVNDGKSVDIDLDLSRNIEEDLRNALLLYKKEGNNFGQAKCHLLLAKLNETNTKSTIDAVEAFKQFKLGKVPIGCLEAVQFFTDLDPHDFYKESFWNVIKESFALVHLLKSHLQSSNLVVKSYLPYFGLSFKDDSVWKSHTTEPLCCISLIEYNICNRMSYASFTFDKFKSWLNKYLKFCIRKLFQILYHKLTIHIIISTPCPFESAELCQSSETCCCHLANFYGSQFSQSEYFCRFQEKKCMHLHESSTLPRFDIRVVICQMLLTIKLQDDFEEFKFFATHLYKALISNLDQDTHLSDVFHPDNINALKICIRNHYKMVFQKMTLLEKVQSSDFYFEVNILFSWLNIRYDLNKLMEDMYQQIGKESFPDVHIVNSSLVSSDNKYMCIYQRFYDSLYFLYERHQPFEAVIQFSKFCVLFLKKRKRILPDLHCLLLWIEFFMTISFMLLMRHCKISVVLSSSHISSVDIIDILQSRFSEKLQDILNSSRMWLNLKLLEVRVAKMVSLIFSDNIFKCLQKEDVNSRKLAKRVFILGLCYIHCFSEQPFENIPDLKFLMKCENVATLVEDPLLRVRDICRLIAENQDVACRLIKATVKVLMQTPEYEISRYYWMFKNGKPLGLQLVSDKQLPMSRLEMADSSPTGVSEIDSEITEKMVEDLISNEEKDKKNDSVMQTKAVQVIENAYLRYRNKLLKELRSLEIPANLPLFSPSEKYCSVCAVSFSSKQWITPFKINGNDSSDEKETLFKHLKKPAHSAKILEFKAFSKLYETRFLPVKERAKNYLDLDLVSDNEEITFYFNLLKLKLQEFDKNLDQICQNANWTETEKLETIAGNIEHFAEKMKQLYKNSEHLKQDVKHLM